ncbi:MAG: hypothetical protein DWQ08_11905 [Proteobacteria bacterium]|nr:MAG: hypothetical protein DWQ08_11905 [Pseudomonadota bacterium]
MLATAIIAATSLAFGTVPLFGKTLLEAGLSAEAIALYRFCLALPLALVYLPRRREALLPASALAGAGLANGIGWTAYLHALEYLPVASAGVVYLSYPLFVVVLAWLLLGQRITLRTLAGALLVVLGAVTVNGSGTLTTEQWPLLLTVLPAPIGFALMIVVISRVGRRLSTLERFSAICVGTVAGLLPTSLAGGIDTLLPATAEAWIWVGAMALITATVPQLLYMFAARAVSPGRAAAAGAVELPTMLAVGAVAFGETIGVAETIGALMVIVAVLVTPAVAPSSARIKRLPWLSAHERT